jgi:hypothetical protein
MRILFILIRTFANNKFTLTSYRIKHNPEAIQDASSVFWFIVIETAHEVGVACPGCFHNT